VAAWLKQRESITHNSNFFGGPLQFELSKFHCISDRHHHHVRPSFSKGTNFIMSWLVKMMLVHTQVAGQSNPGSEVEIVNMAVVRGEMTEC